MKTDTISTYSKGDFLQISLDRIEGLANTQNLSQKDALYLRLLGEELFEIVKGSTGDFSAKFWAENVGNDYVIVLEADAVDLSEDAKKELISISSSGENSNVFGVMDRIRSLFGVLAVGVDSSAMPGVTSFGYGYNNTGEDLSWSLKKYKKAVTEHNLDPAIEEISKSVVANVADDIVVGVKDKKVKIEIYKSFD